ncbi:Ig-like domain-containing protein [Arenibacter sp. GZD96]|uniref:Ig-like domain-containing protein n=1 Tax=Aurantibrevibacter litoralis TaxID=3106030 RepID=UPI002AFE4F0A|nr:Ig-like domain-containing protein [Arenibacter sp. GZD-96]MEA1785628.1 Ig-like domain-containing protein [Arenibacter sp. GZD-96]
MLQRFLGGLFLLLSISALFQCARRGTPTGGIKDIIPPKLIKAVPPNMSINFKEKRIRLYFDEYIKLNKVQEQLIVSPPLTYAPVIKPQGGTSKVVEILIKDTLRENTTYTFNFGYSIVDNNEGNPNSFLTYVFSTGDYIDSLSLSGVVKDAFNRRAETFISVLLYELDSMYTDSTVYQKLPNYITNTLDSTTIFHLKNLKEGKYALFGLKDKGNNNKFDQKVDKIAFLTDTIRLPTDSIYLLNLFKEVPDYTISVPSLAAKNKIIFGYQGIREDIDIAPLVPLPDTVRTLLRKQRDKDSLDFWFTPFEADSIQFVVTNEKMSLKDTFTVRSRKLPLDTLVLSANQRGTLDFASPFSILANTPLVALDSSKLQLMDQDSVSVTFTAHLDTLDNKVDIDFERLPNQKYSLALHEGAITDFFGSVNDSLKFQLATKGYADYGNLRFSIAGKVAYPIILQLTDEKGVVKRTLYATEPKSFEFNLIPAGKYVFRVIFDENGNQKWDTGNYLQKIQPEQVRYYPDVIDVRTNWDMEQTFVIPD